jgi:hypothetical protein
MWTFSSQVLRSGRFIWRMLYRRVFHIILVRATYVAPPVLLRLIVLLTCDEERKLLCYYSCYKLFTLHIHCWKMYA